MKIEESHTYRYRKDPRQTYEYRAEELQIEMKRLKNLKKDIGFNNAKLNWQTERGCIGLDIAIKEEYTQRYLHRHTYIQREREKERIKDKIK